jgi:dTDP-glucose 4,6-dehydratase
METWLVTGGAGFIGSNFVQLIVHQDKQIKVVVLDKLTYAGNFSNLKSITRYARFHFIKGDISDRQLLSKIFKKYKPTNVIHFAAESHVDRSIDSPEVFIHTNIIGTFELLEATRIYLKTQLPLVQNHFRFLHISTDEVYGSLGQRGLFSENSRYCPRSPYSATKAASDHLVHAYFETYRLPILMVHCSNNFGPMQFPEKFVPLTILNAIEGMEIPVYGDGRNVRDWVFVEDFCKAIIVVLQKGQVGDTYNVGGKSEKMNIEVVQEICAQLNHLYPASKNEKLKKQRVFNYEELIRFVKDRPGHDRRYAMNIQKIEKKLGWTPKYSFSQGLNRTIRWYLHNKKWCAEIKNKYARQRLGLLNEKSAKE